MTELLLTVNITALSAVFIHHLITKNPKVSTPQPRIKFKTKKKKELTEEEKRNAEILEDISKYNGMEVTK